MIRRVVKATNGKEITLLTPETEEDIQELERLEAAGLLDTTQSPGDRHTRTPGKAAAGEERRRPDAEG